MKTKCYSVRLKSLVQITDKAYKAKSFDGSEDIIPASQLFGRDSDVSKSEAYWISSWILKKKNIQYSTKKIGWFNPKTGNVEPNYTVETTRHIPKQKSPIQTTINKDLQR
ncbi:MAG: hypothetical protein CSA38_01995 [Flavobacteriales bacterium]|nr:MAG: hypothetical protein CSA38_01995 [Flavobacteriales bacterium]